MKSTQYSQSICRASIFLSTLVLILAGQSPANAQSLLDDDFESYGVGTWPSPWVPDAAAHDPSENYVGVDPNNAGNKAFRLFGSLGGCWAALALHPCAFPDHFEINVRVYNGTEALTGCHPMQACVYLRQGTSSTNQSRRLLIFMGDGTVQGVHGVVLPVTYVPGQWYDVRIAYQLNGTNLTVDYWFDNIHLCSTQVTVTLTTFTHFDLTVQEGSAWFDDVKVLVNDCNGNGVPDDQDLSNGTSLDCNSNGIPDECDIADGTSNDANYNFIPDECECNAYPYCLTSPNTVGPGAVMGYQGSLSIADANFRLQATGCPPNQFGIFYYGSSQIQIPFGDGYRCVGGQIDRLPVVNTGSTGNASYMVDFLTPPTSQITPFSTVNFQFWYRDPAGGGSGFNLSDALAVTPCP